MKMRLVMYEVSRYIKVKKQRAIRPATKAQSHRGKDRSPTFLQPLKTSFRRLVGRG